MSLNYLKNYRLEKDTDSKSQFNSRERLEAVRKKSHVFCVLCFVLCVCMPPPPTKLKMMRCKFQPKIIEN